MDQGQFSDPDVISGTHQWENVQSSSYCKLTCSCHDIAEKLLNWRKKNNHSFTLPRNKILIIGQIVSNVRKFFMHAEVSKFNACFVQNICVFLVEALLTGEVTLDKRKIHMYYITQPNPLKE